MRKKFKKKKKMMRKQFENREAQKKIVEATNNTWKNIESIWTLHRTMIPAASK